MSPDEPAADVAARMVKRAVRLVGAVRDEDARAVDRTVAGLSRREVGALLVVLAAMVDPDRSARDLLAWTEDPASWPAPVLAHQTLRYESGVRDAPAIRAHFQAARRASHAGGPADGAP